VIVGTGRQSKGRRRIKYSSLSLKKRTDSSSSPRVIRCIEAAKTEAIPVMQIISMIKKNLFIYFPSGIQLDIFNSELFLS